VVKISTPSDVVCAVTQLLGFVPDDSIAVLCTHGDRRRLGLAMRFDLALAADPAALAWAIDERVGREDADGCFIVVFAPSPSPGGDLPHRDLFEQLVRRSSTELLDAIVVIAGRWWSYFCDESRCCPPQGNPIDPASPGATALAAAYALQGQGILPSREAVVRSLAFEGGPDEMDAVGALISAARERHRERSRDERRAEVKALVIKLCAALRDPRGVITDEDAAELAALCDDVVVRDEVLVRARKPRRRTILMRVLGDVVRRIPPPYDAAICATLAWVAYADGSGVITNVALDRALATDPTYSLALLTADALHRQLPPWWLEEVMRGAARDLRGRSGAG
jgi:hypothetical protein